MIISFLNFILSVGERVLFSSVSPLVEASSYATVHGPHPTTKFVPLPLSISALSSTALVFELYGKTRS